MTAEQGSGGELMGLDQARDACQTTTPLLAATRPFLLAISDLSFNLALDARQLRAHRAATRSRPEVRLPWLATLQYDLDLHCHRLANILPSQADRSRISCPNTCDTDDNTWWTSRSLTILDLSHILDLAIDPCPYEPLV